MTEQLPFGRVFSESQDDAEAFPGFLLVNHGHSQTANARALAKAYSDATLAALDYGLENKTAPEAAYPGLFLARHTLELYLKGLIPSWDTLRGRQNRHSIDYLVTLLRHQLVESYDKQEITQWCDFLEQISIVDPKSMAFRYRDGAVVSFGKEPLGDPEIWIDFAAMKEALEMTFDAMDRLWLQRDQGEAAE